MKKFVGILMVMVLVVVVVFVCSNVNVNANEGERLNGYIGYYTSDVDQMLREWLSIYHPEALNDEVNDEGVYQGYGIILGNGFEEEYGVLCTKENIIRTLFDVGEEYGVYLCNIDCVGFHEEDHELYEVYRLYIEAEELLDETEEYQKAEMYFMVMYNE